ncbi:hypothetical protein INR49_002244 [Caranx melampygus]|nr:hypothetical protein INR49_002244 [Caranx melampygus]
MVGVLLPQVVQEHLLLPLHLQVLAIQLAVPAASTSSGGVASRCLVLLSTAEEEEETLDRFPDFPGSGCTRTAAWFGRRIGSKAHTAGLSPIRSMHERFPCSSFLRLGLFEPAEPGRPRREEDLDIFPAGLSTALFRYSTVILNELLLVFGTMYVCSHCTISEHVAHSIVSMKDECEAKSVELEQEEAEIQQMIRERQQKIQQIERLKTYSKEDAEKEITNGVQIFTALMQTAERHLNELIEGIEEKQRTTEQQADCLIGELKLEISALTIRMTEIQQLCQTQDHLLLLRSATSVNTPLCTKNWTGVGVRLPSYEGTVVKAVDELEEMLSSRKQKLLHEAKMKRVQHYAVDVTLKPDTANPWLILSDDGKQVSTAELLLWEVYYEVQVTGKTDWTIGVVKRSVNRKEVIPLCPVNGYWAVGLRNGNEFLTLASPVASICLNPAPQRVGVFVSHEEGLVSFYDTDTAVHLFSFTNCCFTEELSPFFCPGLHHGGRNATPLIILPVYCNVVVVMVGIREYVIAVESLLKRVSGSGHQTTASCDVCRKYICYCGNTTNLYKHKHTPKTTLSCKPTGGRKRMIPKPDPQHRDIVGDIKCDGPLIRNNMELTTGPKLYKHCSGTESGAHDTILLLSPPTLQHGRRKRAKKLPATFLTRLTVGLTRV